MTFCRTRSTCYRPEVGLTLDGDCPGPATLTVVGTTPNSNVAIIVGKNPGPFIVPTITCAGITIGIAPPFLAGTPTILSSDANGEVVLRGRIPEPMCGNGLVQAIDLTTCEVSNLVEF